MQYRAPKLYYITYTNIYTCTRRTCTHTRARTYILTERVFERDNRFLNLCRQITRTRAVECSYYVVVIIIVYHRVYAYLLHSLRGKPNHCLNGNIMYGPWEIFCVNRGVVEDKARDIVRRLETRVRRISLFYIVRYTRNAWYSHSGLLELYYYTKSYHELYRK